jgi:hypothetical protein
MWAAMQVLRGKRKPMTAREIYAEISERKLAPGLKGKTPEQTVAAQLATHVKRGCTSSGRSPASFGSSAARRRRSAARAGFARRELDDGPRLRRVKQRIADERTAVSADRFA